MLCLGLQKRHFSQDQSFYATDQRVLSSQVFLTTGGVRWPGYLSFAEDIKFSDMPGGAIASWAALPNLAWAQIVLIVALLDNSVLAQKVRACARCLLVCAAHPW